MQAVILAGGKGTRLYPLTSRTPKPMVNLFNKPVLEHTIDLLKQHGIRDIIITVAYKADQIIDYFGGGSKWGVNIQYSLEDIPLGTAGGLRRMQPLLNDTFLIISGDAVTDFDLKAAVDFHKSKSAIATMLLYEVDNPSQFGIVESESDGHIRRFLEKPSPSETFTNTINTGIYILEPDVIGYIPYDTSYDFSRNVFPRLLQNQEAFYSYRTEGYWCDVGSLAQYRNVHFDALTGRVKLAMPAPRVADGMYVGENAEIHPSVKLRAPFYVGNGVRINRGTSLGRFSVIGDMGRVDEGAHITQSILGSGAVIGKDAQVHGSVIGSGYKIADGRQIEDEVMVHDAGGEHLQAEISSELLSHSISEEHLFTWSGLELARFAAERAATRAVAA
jgi:mannose-1-phosphate guanylyltransferase / phosphomannomutase